MADKANWQVRPEHGERRYRRIDTRLWHDRRFLSFDANGRTVWLFLLTNPRTTAIPGLFPLHEEEAARLCGLTPEGFRDGFAQPFREGMVEADWKAGLVWLKKAARYEPPTGPNVVAAWRKVARMDLPECPLLGRALAGIREQLREVLSSPQPFLDAFAKAFPQPIPEPLGDGFPEGYASQDAGCRMQDAGRTTLSAGTDAPGDDLPDATEHAEEEQPLLVAVPVKPSETPDALRVLWNEVAHPSLPRWQGLSSTRKAAAAARLRERPLAEWRGIIERISRSMFCRGENERGWKASPDWLIQPDTADKVLEGKYDRAGGGAAQGGGGGKKEKYGYDNPYVRAQIDEMQAAKKGGG